MLFVIETKYSRFIYNRFLGAKRHRATEWDIVALYGGTLGTLLLLRQTANMAACSPAGMLRECPL